MATAASRKTAGPPKRAMSPGEWQHRVDLAAAFRLVHLFGWSDLLATHLSARVPGPDDHFLINPFGLLFEEITASNLVKVDVEGRILSETEYDINPAGFTIHSAVHMARPDAACCIHTHTQAGTSVATQKGGLLPITQHALAVIAQTGYHDYQGIATDLAERDSIARDLGDNNVLILRNHGLLTVGRTVGEAWMWMYRAERACRMQIAFQQTGAELSPIPEEVQRVTIERNRFNNSDKGYRPIGKREWPALLRKLDRECPGYDA
ncbi:MAG: class II aldolase/adducin family protein [Hyphomicrobiaceae bacterium]|nr:MAG: class II aldolase/adducin family protein [Hyphomicrobiaceae bacterium]